MFVRVNNVRTISGPNFDLNHLKPTGHVMHRQVQHSITVRSAHTPFMCFVFISEKTATRATYSIN
jgi:hypothetical protein